MTEPLARPCKGVPALPAEACRAARGLLKWTMRDLQRESGVSLPTLLKLENGGQVAAATAEKLHLAFERHGAEILPDGAGVRIRPAPLTAKEALLRSTRFVSVRPRADGTYRVLFEVPPRLRPAGWAPTIPLPLQLPRTGNLENRAEAERIKADAASLYGLYAAACSRGGAPNAHSR